MTRWANMIIRQFFMLRSRSLFRNVSLSTTDSLPGFRILSYHGFVSGSTVRTRNIVKDTKSAFQSILGGELEHYTQLLQDSRQEAMDRMVANCQALGADAVVGVRITTSNVAPSASEVLVYGTAVKTQQIEGDDK